MKVIKDSANLISIDKLYKLTGPKEHSCSEIATMIGQALGKEIKYESLQPGEARSQYLRLGYEEQWVEAMLELCV